MKELIEAHLVRRSGRYEHAIILELNKGEWFDSFFVSQFLQFFRSQKHVLIMYWIVVASVRAVN